MCMSSFFCIIMVLQPPITTLTDSIVLFTSLFLSQTGRPVISMDTFASPPDSHLDPGLVPQSTLRFASHGALFEDPHLETTAGQRVNVLRAGRSEEHTTELKSQIGISYAVFSL